LQGPEHVVGVRLSSLFGELIFIVSMMPVMLCSTFFSLVHSLVIDNSGFTTILCQSFRFNLQSLLDLLQELLHLNEIRLEYPFLLFAGLNRLHDSTGVRGAPYR